MKRFTGVRKWVRRHALAEGRIGVGHQALGDVAVRGEALGHEAEAFAPGAGGVYLRLAELGGGLRELPDLLFRQLVWHRDLPPDLVHELAHLHRVEVFSAAREEGGGDVEGLPRLDGRRAVYLRGVKYACDDEHLACFGEQVLLRPVVAGAGIGQALGAKLLDPEHAPTVPHHRLEVALEHLVAGVVAAGDVLREILGAVQRQRELEPLVLLDVGEVLLDLGLHLVRDAELRVEQLRGHREEGMQRAAFLGQRVQTRDRSGPQDHRFGELVSQLVQPLDLDRAQGVIKEQVPRVQRNVRGDELRLVALCEALVDVVDLLVAERGRDREARPVRLGGWGWHRQEHGQRNERGYGKACDEACPFHPRFSPAEVARRHPGGMTPL